MTLPSSYPLSMSEIATELGTTLPLSMLDPMVIALAVKSAGPVSFSDLLGKIGRYDGTVTPTSSGGGVTADLSYASWLGGGALYTFSVNFSAQTGGASLTFGDAPLWNLPLWGGNITVINNTYGVSLVLTPLNSTTWSCGPGIPGGILSGGVPNSLTIVPS